MMDNLFQWAVFMGLLLLAMRNLALFIAELVFEGLSLVTAEPDTTDITDTMDTTDTAAGTDCATDHVEVIDPAMAAEVAGDGWYDAADGGGWDPLEMFECFELG